MVVYIRSDADARVTPISFRGTLAPAHQRLYTIVSITVAQEVIRSTACGAFVMFLELFAVVKCGCDGHISSVLKSSLNF